MCECHQLIEQCQPINKKIKEKAMEERGFIPTRRETLFLLQWTKKIPNGNMGCNPFPTMGATKEVDPHGV
jgi:hypothetical protein